MRGSNENLVRAISALESVFSHLGFPRDLVPPSNWSSCVVLQDPESFHRELINWVKQDKHPLAWEEMRGIDPNLENTLFFQADATRARVDLSNPKNPYILMKRFPGFDQARVGDIFAILAHEIGHLISPEVEEPIPHDQIEVLRDQICPMPGGENYDLSNLKLRRKGGLRFVTLEGKRLLMFPNFGKYYGIFLDELYADVYKLFVTAHLVIVKADVPLEGAVRLMKKPLGIDAQEDPEGQYNLKLLEYASRAGWTNLVRGGTSSNVETFLKPGTEIYGEEEHRKILDELQTLRSSFSISF